MRTLIRRNGMAHKHLIAALGLLVAASPLSASVRDNPAGDTPVESANGKFCLKVEPNTGSKVENIVCMTREEWDAQGVDLDREWAKEGVVLTGQPA
jgi:hypothetical protein